LEKAVKMDEVKTIRDKAVAMEVYAYQAKDKELVGYAIEVRERAERRLGELMETKRQAGELARHRPRSATESRGVCEGAY
jgi:hypothetical protein